MFADTADMFLFVLFLFYSTISHRALFQLCISISLMVWHGKGRPEHPYQYIFSFSSLIAVTGWAWTYASGMLKTLEQLQKKKKKNGQSTFCVCCGCQFSVRSLIPFPSAASHTRWRRPPQFFFCLLCHGWLTEIIEICDERRLLLFIHSYSMLVCLTSISDRQNDWWQSAQYIRSEQMCLCSVEAIHLTIHIWRYYKSSFACARKIRRTNTRIIHNLCSVAAFSQIKIG